MKPDKEHRKDFDEDLRFGEEGERWLLWLADEARVEVKRERDFWHKSGNLFFEVRYKGAPSGLASTKADWWVHILTLHGKQKSVLVFHVEHLRDKLRAALKSGEVRLADGGDDSNSRGVLVPLKKIHLILNG